MLALYRSAVRGLPPAVWWFSGAAFINRAGTMVLPFLSLYLRDEIGLSMDDVGWILSAFGLGAMFGVYASGPLVDRYGGRRIQIASLFLGGTAFCAIVLFRSFWGIVGATFVAAAVSEAFRPAVMATIAAASDEQNRARSFGLLRLAVNAGMAVGPAVGGLLAEINFWWVFIGDGVTCWLAGLALVLVPIGSANEARGAQGAPNKRGARGEYDAGRRPVAAWRDGPFFVFCILVALLLTAFFQLFFTLPLYLKDVYGWSEKSVGLLIGLNAGLIVLFELPLVTALQEEPPVKILGFGSALVGAGFAVLLFGPYAVLPVVMMVIASFGEMLLFPSANVVVANRAPRHVVGRYMALYGAASSLSFVIAPWLGLQTYGRFGGDGLWGGTIGVFFVVAVLAWGPVRRQLEESASPELAWSDAHGLSTQEPEGERDGPVADV